MCSMYSLTSETSERDLVSVLLPRGEVKRKLPAGELAAISDAIYRTRVVVLQ